MCGSAAAKLTMAAGTWPPKKVVERRRHSFVRNVKHLDAGGPVEDLPVEMMRGANATAGISYFARALAHELGEGRERSRRDAVVDHQTGRIVGDRGDRREILDDVERTRLVLNAVDRLR